MSTRASAYVRQNRLCIIGVDETRLGPVPFAVSISLDTSYPDGPIDMSALDETLVGAIEKAREEIKTAITKGRIELAAENLVLRARAGDQNAMAILIGVKRNAKQGVKRAQVASKAIQKFISKNPPHEIHSTIGLESSIDDAKEPLEKHAAIVAYGPSISPNRLICRAVNESVSVEGVCSALEPCFAPSFQLGYAMRKVPRKFLSVSQRMSADDYAAAKLGFLMGRARLIMMIKEGAPISVLSKMAGWELGE